MEVDVRNNRGSAILLLVVLLLPILLFLIGLAIDLECYLLERARLQRQVDLSSLRALQYLPATSIASLAVADKLESSGIAAREFRVAASAGEV
jgi:uncharacterized membrane protein